MFGLGKKKKNEESSAENEILSILSAILSSQGTGEYNYSGKGGYTRQQDVIPENGGWTGRLISEFDTPEGTRYYPGEGSSQDMQMSLSKAMFDATSRRHQSPSDSITFEQLQQLLELKTLFERK